MRASGSAGGGSRDAALAGSAYPVCPSGSARCSSSPRCVSVRSSAESVSPSTPEAAASSRVVTSGLSATTRRTASRSALRGARQRAGSPGRRPAWPRLCRDRTGLRDDLLLLSSSVVGGFPSCRQTNRRSDHAPPDCTGSQPAATIDATSAPRAASSSCVCGLRTSVGGHRKPSDSATTTCRARLSGGTITAWNRERTRPGCHAISHDHDELALASVEPARWATERARGAGSDFATAAAREPRSRCTACLRPRPAPAWRSRRVVANHTHRNAT